MVVWACMSYDFLIALMHQFFSQLVQVFPLPLLHPLPKNQVVQVMRPIG